MDSEEVITLKSRLGLALSGGSVRAAAHVGVLKALEEYALEPDVVVGTSGGSIVAALYATGLGAQELEELFLEYSRAKGKIVDLNWRGAIVALLTWDIKRFVGVVRGATIEEIIAQSLPIQRFCGLKKCQLLIPAVNLNNGQQTVFCDYRAMGLTLDREGKCAEYPLRDDLSIAQAVRASISIPGVFVPAVFEDDHSQDCYVDGALRDGYPINIAVRLGKATRVLGVNLGYAGMRRETILEDGPLEIFSQSLDIMMRAQYRDRLQDRALTCSRIMTINPLIYDIGTFEVEYIPQMIARGYEVASRLFQERGLEPGRVENKELFFRMIRDPQSFPAENSSYFAYLLEHQIKKKHVVEPEPKAGLFGHLRTLVGKTSTSVY
jgi:NTE family protein